MSARNTAARKRWRRIERDIASQYAEDDREAWAVQAWIRMVLEVWHGDRFDFRNRTSRRPEHGVSTRARVRYGRAAGFGFGRWAPR